MRWLALHVELGNTRSSLEMVIFSSSDGVPPPDLIHFKTTEKFVGFLVYVVGTYTIFTPYLKGIYLTLNNWRPGRTADGWPLPKFEQNFSEVVKDSVVRPHLGDDRPTIKIGLESFTEADRL